MLVESIKNATLKSIDYLNVAQSLTFLKPTSPIPDWTGYLITIYVNYYVLTKDKFTAKLSI